ncbi:MAG: matrixin family metalloprotease [Candidatus Pacearchaeota archaeon]|nr:matrixin family metalloprotease [Candidatus Pacearchaeota archaeon]
MGLKIIIVFLFVLLVFFLLSFYLLVPFERIDFGTKSWENNFSLVSENTSMQFYSNMRFPTNEISYKISDCPLPKENEMESAFNRIQELTILNFYPVSDNEEISITCQNKNKIDAGGLFIAGEGGPVNITVAGDLNVIKKGEILLIRESNCERPNIAIHELLHVLGFEHSDNSNNIMYSITECDQTISDDIIELINKLYSIPSNPDLVFEEVSAEMNGRFLDTTITVRNNGLVDSEYARIMIYADDKNVKEIDLEPLEVGEGKMITITHLWIPQISVNKLDFIIETTFEEINKENNKMTLEITK